MKYVIKNMEAVFFCAAILGLNVAWMTTGDHTDIQISGQVASATTSNPTSRG